MGHYRSEMSGYDDPPRSTAKSGYDNREILDEFFGGKAPVGASTCPRCGAAIHWNWTNVDALLLHIQWHENLSNYINRTAHYQHLKVVL